VQRKYLVIRGGKRERKRKRWGRKKRIRGRNTANDPGVCACVSFISTIIFTRSNTKSAAQRKECEEGRGLGEGGGKKG